MDLAQARIAWSWQKNFDFCRFAKVYWPSKSSGVDSKMHRKDKTVREYIAWQEDFSVGVRVIDEQHKRLLRVINEFLNTQEDGDDHVAISRSLAEMINYTEYHFYTEQLLLERHPDFLSHLNQHWQLIKAAKKIQADFQKNLGMKADVFDFLLMWLKNHILGTDKVYFDYLRKHQLL